MEKALVICIIVILSTLKIGAVSVFTIHKESKPVPFFLAADVQEPRIVIYQYVAESDAGVVVNLIKELDNVLQVEIMGELLYCYKGELAVNTLNYDNTAFCLYTFPTASSKIFGCSQKQQTVIISGICNKWLYVQALDDSGNTIYDWLAPEMQCPLPWTTCS